MFTKLFSNNCCWFFCYQGTWYGSDDWHRTWITWSLLPLISFFCDCIAVESPKLHEQFGHPSLSILKQMLQSLSKISTMKCESCWLGKHIYIHLFLDKLKVELMPLFSIIPSYILGPSRGLLLVLDILFLLLMHSLDILGYFFMKNSSEHFSIFTLFFAEACLYNITLYH